ncbi:RHS repeat-associated core domain-containing protein [Pseudomonas deceptionensis]|uniref:Insecticidal toxin complex protein TccC n=1 Tax=Pseudomonas deceptionensis TaxID=882211 RepID=A0A1H5P5N6_PSEDM|nr:RHS repeat-associated core domain-containing protein [Pseudomonas deceptionensis]SEF08278.1 insecticidal toxin complex protein TccC [Pseudomonas deceptionensis]
MNSLLHQKTPVLTSLDGRAALLRTVAYHRAHASEVPSTRVTRQRYDALGHLTEQWDPRLYDLAATDTRVKANQQARFSLSGQELRSDSVDAGWRVSLFNAAAQAVTLWDGRGSLTRSDYDEQLRPVALFETAAGDTAERCVERFAYAANTTEDAQRNRCGRVLRHDDPAGSVWHEAFTVTGQPAIETRRFCLSLTTPDWPNTPLDTRSYSTRWRYDALGAVMAHTDAAGHVRTFAVDIAGRPRASQLDGLDLLKRCEYNAFDQVDVEQAGNDVLTIASYSPANGLLQRLKANTLAGHLLQDLHYQYDPVGNVERIEDLAQPVQWFAQQQIKAVSTYRYDTLYQLIEATGRENASQRIGPELPGLEIFGVRDDSHWRNYTQTYTYDSGANLTSLKHDAGAGNTHLRQMVVAERSNRSLFKGEVPVDFASGFDANGNQQALVLGQLMHWNTRNQLHQVTQVAREEPDGQDDDVETYIYDGTGQRVRKVRRAKTGGGEQVLEVLYLPGLEIRTPTVGKQLHVVTTQAGRNHVRALHWQAEPDLWRYILGDHLGSSTLELDHAGELISQECYYPFGGTSWWAARSAVQARYKTARYSGKERDATGLYYYGARYYAPWLQRWINPDPAGTLDGLNLFRMVRNSPVILVDVQGLMPTNSESATTSASTPGPSTNQTTIADDIRTLLTPLLSEIAITDVPYVNANQQVQYKHDSNHARVRTRRIQTAKDLGMSLSDAVNDRNFQLSLAEKVSTERDERHQLFGQCAEMAYLSATKLKTLAQNTEHNVYTFQQPDANHTLTLFSKQNYKSGDKINWKTEQSQRSLIVDLWQGVLSPEHPTALVNSTQEHLYTHNQPRSFIQSQVWNFNTPTKTESKPKNSKTTLGKIRRLFK